MARTVLTVFLSSTGKDLEDYRAEIRRQLEASGIFKCSAMETFGPQDATAVDYCEKASRESDLFVCIIGHRRSWEPKGDNKQRSITEMEYDSATSRGRPRFIAIAPDDFPVSNALRESDTVHARQQDFRKRVLDERVAGVHNFSSPSTLAAEFLNSLYDLIKNLRPDLVASEIAQAQAPVAAAVEKLAESDDVDLLAFARNPQGIDLADLEQMLRSRAEFHESEAQEQRRKSAEFYRHIGALAYLHDTGKALDAYRHAVDLDPDDAEGWNELGRLLRRTGALDAAIEAYERVLTLGNETADQALIAVATGNLGIIFEARGDLDRAEELFRKALSICEALGLKEGMANSYGNLGNIDLARDDLDQAEEMYRKVLSIDEPLGRKHSLAATYGNLGNIDLARGDLDQAEKMYSKALAIYEALGLKEGVASQYGNLGILYQTRNNLDKAEEMYRKSLAIETKLDRKSGMASDYANLGLLEIRRANMSAACDHWRKSRDLFRALGSPNAAMIEFWMRDAGCPD